MLPAEIKFEFDKAALEKMVSNEVSASIQRSLWLVSVEKLSELTCIPRSTLEQEILSDVRFKAIEIKKARKRYYPSDMARDVLFEILNEW